MISEDIHKTVSRLVLDHCRAQYEELSATWRDIERKAQGLVAICAALLGATFLLFRSIDNPEISVSVFFIASMILFLIAVINALRALVVKEIECIEDSSQIRQAGVEILSLDDDGQARKKLREFVFDHAKSWEKICNELHSANNEKSTHLASSQKWLFSGVIGLAISLTLLLLEAF